MVVSLLSGVVVGSSADVVVGERGPAGHGWWQRLTIQAVREDGPHAAIARGAERAGALARVLHPRGLVPARRGRGCRGRSGSPARGGLCARGSGARRRPSRARSFRPSGGGDDWGPRLT